MEREEILSLLKENGFNKPMTEKQLRNDRNAVLIRLHDQHEDIHVSYMFHSPDGEEQHFGLKFSRNRETALKQLAESKDYVLTLPKWAQRRILVIGHR